MTGLEGLSLQANRLSSVPPELAAATHLRFLDLSRNKGLALGPAGEDVLAALPALESVRLGPQWCAPRSCCSCGAARRTLPSTQRRRTPTPTPVWARSEARCERFRTAAAVSTAALAPVPPTSARAFAGSSLFVQG